MPQTTLGTQVTTMNQRQMKEDFADIIYNLSPTDTPFQSLCKRTTDAKQVTVNWTEDTLRTSDAPPAIDEGVDAPLATGLSTGIESNWTQIFTEVARVSGTADAVQWYGRAKEMAYQMAKKGAEMKNSLESTLVNFANHATGTPLLTGTLLETRTDRVANGPASPRAMKNFMYLEGFSPLGDGTPAQSQDRTIYDGGGVFISERILTLAHQKVWKLGGDPRILMVDGSTAVAIAGFAVDTGIGTSGRFRDSGQDKKLVNVVDLYISPFGELSVVINRFFPTVADTALNHQAFFLDPKYLEICYLRPPFQHDLAVQGDYERKQLLMECTLKVLSSDASGALVNFSAA